MATFAQVDLAMAEDLINCHDKDTSRNNNRGEEKQHHQRDEYDGGGTYTSTSTTQQQLDTDSLIASLDFLKDTDDNNDNFNNDKSYQSRRRRKNTTDSAASGESHHLAAMLNPRGNTNLINNDLDNLPSSSSSCEPTKHKIVYEYLLEDLDVELSPQDRTSPNVADFPAAKEHALNLYNDIKLPYHNRDTMEQLLERSQVLTVCEGLSFNETCLMELALLFSAVSISEGYFRPEFRSCTVARNILPQFGCGESHVNIVCNAIRSTIHPQNPLNKLEGVLCDTLNSYMQSRSFFAELNWMLDELRTTSTKADLALKNTMTHLQFYQSHIQKMMRHEFFSQTAKFIWSVDKAENQRKLCCAVQRLRSKSALKRGILSSNKSIDDYEETADYLLHLEDHYRGISAEQMEDLERMAGRRKSDPIDLDVDSLLSGRHSSRSDDGCSIHSLREISPARRFTDSVMSPRTTRTAMSFGAMHSNGTITGLDDPMSDDDDDDDTYSQLSFDEPPQRLDMFERMKEKFQSIKFSLGKKTSLVERSKSVGDTPILKSGSSKVWTSDKRVDPILLVGPSGELLGGQITTTTNTRTVMTHSTSDSSFLSSISRSIDVESTKNNNQQPHELKQGDLNQFAKIWESLFNRKKKTADSHESSPSLKSTMGKEQQNKDKTSVHINVEPAETVVSHVGKSQSSVYSGDSVQPVNYIERQDSQNDMDLGGDDDGDETDQQTSAVDNWLQATKEPDQQRRASKERMTLDEIEHVMKTYCRSPQVDMDLDLEEYYDLPIERRYPVARNPSPIDDPQGAILTWVGVHDHDVDHLRDQIQELGLSPRMNSRKYTKL
eukprot:TRINITY_DN13248_c0_g1_i2.p1 TRINITY_DN13248_c0_g1~~TRINITY_DN13248_c0_g1_i2.p1  ORF type:complete len:851 (+),score=185.57 TRINITY_DN13248_c0_g1_i2:57-2555(+)